MAHHDPVALLGGGEGGVEVAAVERTTAAARTLWQAHVLAKPVW